MVSYVSKVKTTPCESDTIDLAPTDIEDRNVKQIKTWLKVTLLRKAPELRASYRWHRQISQVLPGPITLKSNRVDYRRALRSNKLYDYSRWSSSHW